MTTPTTQRKPVNPAILKDIQSLEQSAILELFELDITGILGYDGKEIPAPTEGLDKILRFHAGTNELRQNVVWKGKEYAALPVESEGFDVSVNGTLPRPKIRVANSIGDIGGLFGSSVMKLNDLIGAKLTRKRTYVKYLDSVNFVDGNPHADPYKEFPDDVFFVEQKLSENRQVIEWELVSSFDLSGVLLPRRQVVQNSCTWRYRHAECNYTPGLMFTEKDEPTSDSDLDVCSKTLQACRKRFGNNVILPYGGFPGAKRYE